MAGRQMSDAIDLTIPNVLEDLAQVHGPVRTLLESHAVGERAAYTVKLVLEEMVSNVIRHGYDDAGGHEIGVRVAVAPEAVTVRIVDDARPFDPLDAPRPKCPGRIEDIRAGGLGIHMVREMVDDLTYQRHEGRNIVEARIGR
jgi:serine/threonine-protein kinase RsbW